MWLPRLQENPPVNLNHQSTDSVLNALSTFNIDSALPFDLSRPKSNQVGQVPHGTPLCERSPINAYPVAAYKGAIVQGRLAGPWYPTALQPGWHTVSAAADASTNSNRLSLVRVAAISCVIRGVAGCTVSTVWSRLYC